jgi:aminopeptidase-like protein
MNAVSGKESCGSSGQHPVTSNTGRPATPGLPTLRPWPTPDIKTAGQNMMDLARDLFPLHRTLVSKGYADSLDIIRRRLDLQVQEYPSGQAVWDWEIPQAWDVKQAYIEDSRGNRLVDFADNNLHLSAYSIPFDEEVSKDELLRHLSWLEDRPTAIPYNYLYYRRDWQFNIAYDRLKRFTDDRYRVHIDVDCRPGTLKIGDCYLPGESKREWVFSTYLCHPSLANDNLSGVVAAVELFKWLARLENRRYSYRLLIVPETVGAITYLANHEDTISGILGAYVVYDCGDSGPIHYKRSYTDNALVDRVAEHVLRHYVAGAKIRPWYPGGSDERQFNAPGVRIPAGALTRTPAAEYPEYHTSLDTLDVLSGDRLAETTATLFQFVRVIERNRVFMNRYKGEPCVSRHGLSYPVQHRDERDETKYLVKKCMHEFDGTQSLLQIAEKWDAPFDQVESIAAEFHRVGLIEPVPDPK